MLPCSPGPYRPNVALRSDGGIVVAHVVDANGSTVAQMADYGVEVTGANARLLAAAPELRKALQVYRGQYADRPTWPDDEVESLSMAEAALALCEAV